MNNFKLIKNNIDVSPFLQELQNYFNDHIWSYSRANIVQEHRDTKSIHLRDVLIPKNTKSKFVMPKYPSDNNNNNKLNLINYPCFVKLYSFLEDFANSINGRLVRVAIVNLKPNGRVLPHIDEGEFYLSHDRYHLVLKTDGSMNICDGQTQYYKTGEIWWFDNKKVHEAFNTGVDDRIHVIFDIYPHRHNIITRLTSFLEKQLALAYKSCFE